MEIDELKRKLRQLKKTEYKIRSQNCKDLIWDDFFSTKELYDLTVKYSLDVLLRMGKAQYKAVVEEYYLYVYLQVLKESGNYYDNIYNPGLLGLLGLNPYATEAEVKKRFRELAKIHHPDHGGDNEKMAELIDIYNKLIR